MSSRLEKQDRDDAIHSFLVLLLVAICGISFYLGMQQKQKEIEKRALQLKDVTPDQERIIELVIFGESQL